jgi:hypothetical protein
MASGAAVVVWGGDDDCSSISAVNLPILLFLRHYLSPVVPSLFCTVPHAWHFSFGAPNMITENGSGRAPREELEPALSVFDLIRVKGSTQPREQTHRHMQKHNEV